MELTPTSINPNAEADTPKLASTEGQGTQEDTSAEAVTPESQSTEVEGAKEGTETEKEETTEEAAAADTEENKHKKTLEERAAEIAERKVKEALERIEREREEKAKQDVPVPSELDYGKLRRDIAKSHAREKELQEEIAVDPDNVSDEVINELLQIQRWRNAVLKEAEEYEASRQEALKKKEAEQQYTQYWKVQNERIDETLKVMQQTSNTPDEVIVKGREVWRQMVTADPLLQRQFDEGIMSGRLTETVQWAWKLAKERLEKDSAAALQKRNEGKEKQVAGDSGGETANLPANIKTFDQLMKLPSAQINKFAREHPKAFEALKQKQFR